MYFVNAPHLIKTCFQFTFTERADCAKHAFSVLSSCGFTLTALQPRETQLLSVRSSASLNRSCQLRSSSSRRRAWSEVPASEQHQEPGLTAGSPFWFLHLNAGRADAESPAAGTRGGGTQHQMQAPSPEFALSGANRCSLGEHLFVSSTFLSKTRLWFSLLS